ncbi:H-2 class II histocompatibility antigen, E-D alpha chain-like [Anolis sagrei]|uniref:H-2 class II histocompatibility antigen, E-D alpha chain-like n=1 Tax=Anolis sagrei TaxID=38937 RepID=UPI003521D8B7
MEGGREGPPPGGRQPARRQRPFFPNPRPNRRLLFLLAEEANYVNLAFFLESFPGSGPKAEAGEYLDEVEGEAVLQVDWARRTVSWNLPDFSTFIRFEAAGALGSLSVTKSNLETFMELSNRTLAQNAAPTARVFPEDPVELGDPNILICFVDRFSPPVLNVTWLKNGEVVSEGVVETGFLPSEDNAFRKFSYLTFVPEEGDFYTCRVEHWGLPEPLTQTWGRFMWSAAYFRRPSLADKHLQARKGGMR